MIRKAIETDLPEAARIYEEILDQEDRRETSFTNWQRGKISYLSDRPGSIFSRYALHR